MTSSDSRLVRHLGVVVAVKLILLVALWWVFVRVDRVSVDAEAAAAHVANPAPPAATTGARP